MTFNGSPLLNILWIIILLVTTILAMKNLLSVRTFLLFLLAFVIINYLFDYSIFSIILILGALLSAEVIMGGTRLKSSVKYDFLLFLVIVGVASFILGLSSFSDIILSTFFIVLAISIVGDLIYEN